MKECGISPGRIAYKTLWEYYLAGSDRAMSHDDLSIYLKISIQENAISNKSLKESKFNKRRAKTYTRVEWNNYEVLLINVTDETLREKPHTQRMFVTLLEILHDAYCVYKHDQSNTTFIHSHIFAATELYVDEFLRAGNCWADSQCISVLSSDYLEWFSKVNCGQGDKIIWLMLQIYLL